MIALELLFVMEPSLLPTSNSCQFQLLSEGEIIRGHNGRGKKLNVVDSIADIIPRIFRTDYGHTEVAAHFGNG